MTNELKPDWFRKEPPRTMEEIRRQYTNEWTVENAPLGVAMHDAKKNEPVRVLVNGSLNGAPRYDGGPVEWDQARPRFHRVGEKPVETRITNITVKDVDEMMQRRGGSMRDLLRQSSKKIEEQMTRAIMGRAFGMGDAKVAAVLGDTHVGADFAELEKRTIAHMMADGALRGDELAGVLHGRRAHTMIVDDPLYEDKRELEAVMAKMKGLEVTLHLRNEEDIGGKVDMDSYDDVQSALTTREWITVQETCTYSEQVRPRRVRCSEVVSFTEPGVPFQEIKNAQ